MLELRIAALKGRLNRLIDQGVELDRLYDISVQLDRLIAEYYHERYKGRS